MKALFKPLFAAFAALTLILSLSGCFEEGAKTASQGDGASSLAPDSGKVKLVLKPGVRAVSVDFSTNQDLLAQHSLIEDSLKESGIIIKKKRVMQGKSPFVHFDVELVRKESVLYISKGGILSVEVLAGDRIVAKWNSMGAYDEVQYVT